jgi:hypothetical protein
MNKGGPKTKLEVQKEVEDKYKAEATARNNRDGNRGYNNYDNNRNDRNNNDRRDKNYNNNDRRDGKPQYQKKDGQGGGSYGNGGRENRDSRGNNDRKTPNKRTDQPVKQETTPFDDEEMGNILKKNFEDFANKKKMAEEGMGEAEDEEPQSIEPDLSVYEKFKSENGK